VTSDFEKIVRGPTQKAGQYCTHGKIHAALWSKWERFTLAPRYPTDSPKMDPIK
jgi:hypothetical protein